jgi:hypothetical protein
MDPFSSAAVSDSPGTPSAAGKFAGAIRERAFALSLTASFLLVAALGALHHEPARDELHGWLLARDSANLWNVFQITRYEAHFVLWRVFLFGITRFTHNPLALQFFNLVLATTTIWLVARFSPFRKLEKCLLSFGYFFLFEYCIVAQDYTLVVLMMFCFCALYPRRARRPMSLAVVLFLLANSLPYGLLIALIFLALLVFDWVVNSESGGLRTARRLRGPALMVLAGLVCATAQLLLMRASPYTTWKHPLTMAGLADVALNIWRAYIPIPWGFPVWNHLMLGSNFIDGVTVWRFVKVTLSLLLGVVSAGLLLRRPPALFLYVVGVALLFFIQTVVNAGALRHKAFLFLLFVAALWIAGDSADREPCSALMQRLGKLFARWRNPFVVGLLSIQAIVGIDMYGADWCYPFSAGKQTARFLRVSGLSNLPIVGCPEAPVASLAAYLDKPIYYLQSSRFGTYADQSRQPEQLSGQQVVKKTIQFAQQRQTDVVLVLAYLTLELQTAGTEITSARVNADGLAVSPSAPRSLSCATITLMAQVPCFVDEPYSVYVVQLD